MIAALGDEAFVMLAMFPKYAVILFAILFVIGIFSGWLIDMIVKKYIITTCENCKEMVINSKGKNFKHYVKEHIWGHIIKKHLWKTALWTFGTLAVVEFGLKYLHLEQFQCNTRLFFVLLESTLV